MKPLLVFLMLLPLLSFGTCIVIFTKGSEIYVAADSKMTFKNSSKPPQTICKIYNVGKYYFALSGYGVRSLQANALVSLKKHPDITTAIERFGKGMQRRYRRFWRRMKTKSPALYEEAMYTNFAAVSFFYIDNGQPIIKTIRFRLTDAGQTSVSYRVNDRADHVFMGYDDHIRRLSPQEHSDLIDKHPGHFESYCQELVEMELKYHPDIIGDPIDLMKLSSNGEATWFTEKRNCKF